MRGEIAKLRLAACGCLKFESVRIRGIRDCDVGGQFKNDSSCPGLTRASINLRKMHFSRWIAGSSPAMTSDVTLRRPIGSIRATSRIATWEAN
jgi:hypothetical protein